MLILINFKNLSLSVLCLSVSQLKLYILYPQLIRVSQPDGPKSNHPYNVAKTCSSLTVVNMKYDSCVYK